MAKLKITKDLYFMTSGTEVVSMPMQIKICNRISGSTYEEAKANAELLQNALTISNKCDKLPSQILEERDKLLKLLKSILSTIENSEEWWMSLPNKGGFDTEEIEELIKSIE